MRPAISFCCLFSEAGSSVNHFPAARMDFSATSEMSSPAIFTASASGFSRLPWQTSQGWAEKKRPISSRTQAELVSFQRRSRFGMTPSKTFFVS